MKIGIITMHKVRNFGSALQAYGLQTALENLGHEVSIIDYKYPNKFSRVRKPIDLKMHFRDIMDEYGLLKYINPEAKRFSEFHRFFHLTKRYNTPEDLRNNPPLFDLYMTGSDQVWNPVHTNGDTSFLLDFVPAGCRKVAYAASFATRSLSDKMADIYKPLLCQYYSVGVREHNGKTLFESLTGKSASVVLDPSLLLSGDDWRKIVEKYHNPWLNQEYVLAYFLSYAYNPFPYAFQLANFVSNKLGKKLICLCLEPNIDDYNRNLPHVEIVRKVGPIQFIQLFMGASFVVTTSFHGTAFASNFNKPLFSVVNPNSDDDRQSSFLKAIDREESVIACGVHFKNLNINQSPSLDKLDKKREDSYSFLKKSLQ